MDLISGNNGKPQLILHNGLQVLSVLPELLPQLVCYGLPIFEAVMAYLRQAFSQLAESAQLSVFLLH